MSQLVASGAPAFARGDSRPRAEPRVNPEGRRWLRGPRDPLTGEEPEICSLWAPSRRGLEVRARLLGTRGLWPVSRFLSPEAGFLVQLLSVVVLAGGWAAGAHATVRDARHGDTAPATSLATPC